MHPIGPGHATKRRNGHVQGITPEANLVLAGTHTCFHRLENVRADLASSFTRPEVLLWAGQEVLTMGYKILAVFNPGNIPTIFSGSEVLVDAPRRSGTTPRPSNCVHTIRTGRVAPISSPA